MSIQREASTLPPAVMVTMVLRIGGGDLLDQFVLARRKLEFAVRALGFDVLVVADGHDDRVGFFGQVDGRLVHERPFLRDADLDALRRTAGR